MSRSKFNAIRTEVDGIVFASKKEAKRYGELKILLKANKISLLELQPRFPIRVAGKEICTYVADFSYFDPSLQASMHTVIEDVKGMKTPVYRLKKKLVEAIYAIEIREV